MNILAIDYGAKRIGLAMADSELKISLPFGILETGKWKLEMGEILQREKVGQIVVGLPIGLDSKENENTRRVRKFVEELKRQVDIPIEFVDERFTTKEAEKMGGNVSSDEKAAMLILQSYLDKNK